MHEDNLFIFITLSIQLLKKNSLMIIKNVLLIFLLISEIRYNTPLSQIVKLFINQKHTFKLFFEIRTAL